MRKLPLILGVMLLAAAPAFAANSAAPEGTMAPAPTVTSATPASPEPAEGVAAGKAAGMEASPTDVSKGKALNTPVSAKPMKKKHIAHKAHAKPIHKASTKKAPAAAPAEQPVAAPEVPPAQ